MAIEVVEGELLVGGHVGVLLTAQYLGEARCQIGLEAQVVVDGVIPIEEEVDVQQQDEEEKQQQQAQWMVAEMELVVRELEVAEDAVEIVWQPKSLALRG
jgi:hypothetical protein